MIILIFSLAYLIIAILAFVALFKRLEPLDIIALLSILFMALFWPYYGPSHWRALLFNEINREKSV